MQTTLVTKNPLFVREGYLYDVQTDTWTSSAEFQFNYVFPVCGTYKKDGGIL